MMPEYKRRVTAYQFTGETRASAMRQAAAWLEDDPTTLPERPTIWHIQVDDNEDSATVTIYAYTKERT